MLIDTHAHLNFNVYKDDADEVIRRSLNSNIWTPTHPPPVKEKTWIINVGTNYETSKKAVEIAEKYPEGVFSTIGLHPINLDTGLVKIKTDELEGKHFEKEFDYQKYEKVAKSKKVVAIGEIGLDYYYKPKTKKRLGLFKEKQKGVLSQQLNLAKELNLPVIFHCRMAHDDLLEVLKSKIKNQKSKINGVMHGFVGTTEQLEKYLELGLNIGFNGIIFKKIEGVDFEENIRNTPLDKILIETDCPYLIPPQLEGRNEPFYVKYVAEKIAQIKNISFKEIAKITTENAKNLFKL